MRQNISGKIEWEEQEKESEKERKGERNMAILDKITILTYPISPFNYPLN